MVLFVWESVRVGGLWVREEECCEASSVFGYYKMYGKGKYGARKVQRQTSRHDLVKDAKGGEEEEG